MDAPFVIIGGDAAGMSAASKIMRERPSAQVVVFERSNHISYSACGMPYWIGGVVESDRRLMVLTPEVARKKRGIDVRIRHEVIAINAKEHSVAVTDLQSGDTFQQSYSKLCIATGARPMIPPITGVGLPGVFTLRLLSDAQKIHEYMERRSVQAALIIGAGYVGIEMAEAMKERSLETHLVEAESHVMPNLDAEMVEKVSKHLNEKGVQLQMETKVESITQNGDRLQILTNHHDKIDVDIVIIATGVRPNSELAAANGLQLSEHDAIAVDRMFRTSAPDVFAAGDCAAHHHIVLDQTAWIPLATSANKGGRIVGENMLGGNATFPGILGTAIVKAFDFTIASTGITEEEARKCGQFGENGEFVGATVIEADDRARYWPGVTSLQVKLVFDKRGGRLLGGQLVGMDGVNKRIDIIATAITARMNVNDLALLDLSYAPPYSTSHDPIQVCANVAQREVIANGHS